MKMARSSELIIEAGVGFISTPSRVVEGLTYH